MVAVWEQDGTSTVYLNGVQGDLYTSTVNGIGWDKMEQLLIGGTGAYDFSQSRAGAIKISDVRKNAVYVYID